MAVLGAAVNDVYRPLRVRDGILMFGTRAVFSPEGLVVRPVNGRVRTLPWDGDWSAATNISFKLWLGAPRLVIRDGGPHDLMLSGRGMTPFGEARTSEVVLPLIEYLRDTPAARVGLAHPARVTALIRALRTASDDPFSELLDDR